MQRTGRLWDVSLRRRRAADDAQLIPPSNARPSSGMRLQAEQGPARRIALAFATRFPHLPKIVRGIADYARAHGHWLFTTGGESFYFPIEALGKWRGDGIITVLRNADEAAAA